MFYKNLRENLREIGSIITSGKHEMKKIKTSFGEICYM